MKKQAILLLLTPFMLLAPRQMRAQNYSTASIPDSLRKDARAVLRDDEIVLEIKSPGKAVLRKRQVFTVLNSNGDHMGGYVADYDRFTSISDISGVLYDSLGKVVRKAKRKDMQDRSYEDGFSLATDARYLEHNFYCQVYPYTVDYQEEDEDDGIEDFDAWTPLINSGISTQYSKYVIIAPKDYTVRYLLMSGATAPVITEEKEKKIYTWEARNLPARKTESHGPRWREIAPYVLMGPSDFEAQGYKGNMSSWTDYGKFIDQLRAGRDVLPDNVKQQVHALADTIHDVHQKVYALYRYLQQNTHYISIQLGIGGLQPFPADYVATKKYGDCKALANYMVSLLKEAGIKGKYVEIAAGEDAAPLVEKFPCHQFNHAISCVPLEKDTIWLECTDQTESPNYMGAFTGGRKGVLSDEDGGHVVTTPSYSAADNTQCRVVHAQLGPDGNLDVNVGTMYHCVRQDGPQAWMDNASEADRRKHLNELFDLPTYSVDKSHYEEQQGAHPVVREDLHVNAPNYASVSGKRLFINPNIFDRWRTRLPADSIRKYDYINDNAYTDIDSVVIAVPAGYQVEARPRDVSIQGEFGTFRTSLSFANDKLVYYRYLQQSEARYPPAEYQALVKFYEQLYQNDNQRVVLVKKE
jgi:hypothetical protein